LFLAKIAEVAKEQPNNAVVVLCALGDLCERKRNVLFLAKIAEVAKKGKTTELMFFAPLAIFARD
jgi:hypothetical protein